MQQIICTLLAIKSKQTNKSNKSSQRVYIFCVEIVLNNAENKCCTHEITASLRSYTKMNDFAFDVIVTPLMPILD